MNPAFRIWSLALLFCFVFAVIVSIIEAGASGFMFVIFFIVAVASVASLIGFYLLFEALKQISSNRWIFWIGSLVSVPIIVFLNAWLLMYGFERNFSLSADGAGQEVLAFAAIPLGATILSMFVSYKYINRFLAPYES